MIIKETKNYKVVVAPASSINTAMCYQIVNKKYGVVEVETFMLPQALGNVEDLEAGLQALEDMSGE